MIALLGGYSMRLEATGPQGGATLLDSGAGGLGHHQNLESLSNVIGSLVELNLFSSESTLSVRCAHLMKSCIM